MSKLEINFVRIGVIAFVLILLYMTRVMYKGYLVELKRFETSTLLTGPMANRWVLTDEKMKWFKRADERTDQEEDGEEDDLEDNDGMIVDDNDIGQNGEDENEDDLLLDEGQDHSIPQDEKNTKQKTKIKSNETYNILHLGCGTGDKQLSYRPPMEAVHFYEKYLSKFANEQQIKLIIFSDNERFSINKNCGFQWHNLKIKDNIPEPDFHIHSVPIQVAPSSPELEGLHYIDMVIDTLSYTNPSLHLPKNMDYFSTILPSGGIYFISKSNILDNSIRLNDTDKIDKKLEEIKYLKNYRFKKCWKIGCFWKRI